MEKIIPLSSENIAQFVPLYRSVFNSPPWNDGWSDTAVAERLAAFAACPNFHGFGLTHAGESMGLVFGQGERWVNGWTFHIKELCVHAAVQRQGQGKKLMLAFEAHLQQLGFLGADLQTADAAPARLFYEGLGYKSSGLVSLYRKFA
ncbi:GNAT family N-acetyltransferase [Variovorax sp. H27-G14]|uniref:GNAT family N-acetyltransferase n=1 Tax=Variovorax sp. H27-G14 TaxID=3111914 RepID=UPI0038FC7089